ncbi:hypothetical protein [Flavobacterium fluvii]|uniref:hypothetical protein n=1 Tax=Flavobacterium fluvii TaxID=468056 RepID=UPI0009342B84|nr:hypothetical protein [Flavobacterium fluvii]
MKESGAKHWDLSVNLGSCCPLYSRFRKTTAKKPCFSKSGDAAPIRAKQPKLVIFWKNKE